MLQIEIPQAAYIYFSGILSTLSLLAIIAVVLPLIRSDFWLFRALEYPRFQKFGVSLMLLLLWIFCWPVSSPLQHAIAAGLALGAIYQLYKIWPYTLLGKKEMLRVKSVDAQNRISLLCFNVLQTNRKYDRALKQIRQCDADVILLLETDAGWEETMRDIEKNYPYTLKKPLPNTYGLLFYSKLKTVGGEVR
ncbi:MAG: endonuclease/exonuclease/phosphatase family protein, partial [Mucilaginibacter polytrichastri]|nr:endonuclease/exonuclease/phosphatase family protein [Mucilaginibacter polytrichastri]